MNEKRVARAIETDPVARKIFTEVFAADELPSTPGRWPTAYVVNTDVKGRPGTHWTAFYFPKTGPAEFFDSLGRPPEYYHRRFKTVLLRNGPRLKYKIQSSGSKLC